MGGVKKRSEAGHSCNTMNSFLVSIHSDAESEFVSTLCMNLSGLADDDGRPSCYIGLTQTATADQDWSWDDGTDVNYTKWGRARMLVGDYEAVTVNGDWIVGGLLDFISLGINVILMCCSTAALIYAAHAQNAAVFKVSLGGDAIGSILCIVTLLLWGLGHATKDPARNLPVIALCGLQGLTTLLILCIQLCFAGLAPKWHATTRSHASRAQTVSTFVQPQTVPSYDT